MFFALEHGLNLMSVYVPHCVGGSARGYGSSHSKAIGIGTPQRKLRRGASGARARAPRLARWPGVVDWELVQLLPQQRQCSYIGLYR